MAKIKLLIINIIDALRPYRITLVDKYITKEFIKMLIGSHSLFLSLFMFSAFINDLPYFIDRMNAGDKAVTMEKILSMYINSIPYKLIWVSPISFIFSTMYSLGNCYKHNEAVAYIAAGVHITRLAMPIILISFTYSALLIPFNDLVTAPSHNKSEELKLEMRHKGEKNSNRNLEIFGENDIYYLIKRYDKKRQTMFHPIIAKERKINPNTDLDYNEIAFPNYSNKEKISKDKLNNTNKEVNKNTNDVKENEKNINQKPDEKLKEVEENKKLLKNKIIGDDDLIKNLTIDKAKKVIEKEIDNAKKTIEEKLTPKTKKNKDRPTKDTKIINPTIEKEIDNAKKTIEKKLTTKIKKNKDRLTKDTKIINPTIEKEIDNAKKAIEKKLTSKIKKNKDRLTKNTKIINPTIEKEIDNAKKTIEEKLTPKTKKNEDRITKNTKIKDDFPYNEIRRKEKKPRIINPKTEVEKELARYKAFFRKIAEPLINLSITEHNEEYYDKLIKSKEKKYLSPKETANKKGNNQRTNIKELIKRSFDIIKIKNKPPAEEDSENTKQTNTIFSSKKTKPILGNKKTKPIFSNKKTKPILGNKKTKPILGNKKTKPAINRQYRKNKESNNTEEEQTRTKGIELSYEDIHKLSLIPEGQNKVVAIIEVEKNPNITTELAPKKKKTIKKSIKKDHKDIPINIDKETVKTTNDNLNPLATTEEMDILTQKDFINSLSFSDIPKETKLEAKQIEPKDFGIEPSIYLKPPYSSYFEFRIDAKKVVWNKEIKKWIAYDGELREWDENNKLNTTQFKKYVINKATDKPSHFIIKNRPVDQLTIAETYKLIASLKRARKKWKELDIDLYSKKFAFPFATFLIVLMGSALGQFHSRKLVFINSLFKGIVIFVIYFSIFQISISFSKVVDFLPIAISPWIGNILFFTIAVIALRRAKT